MFRNILCLENKDLLNDIQSLTVSRGYFVKKEYKYDKDEILLDKSGNDNMALILETRLLQTFVKSKRSRPTLSIHFGQYNTKWQRRDIIRYEL